MTISRKRPFLLRKSTECVGKKSLAETQTAIIMMCLEKEYDKVMTKWIGRIHVFYLNEMDAQCLYCIKTVIKTEEHFSE